MPDDNSVDRSINAVVTMGKIVHNPHGLASGAHKVIISNGDGVPDFLINKLEAGDGISFRRIVREDNNEQLVISAIGGTGGGGSTRPRRKEIVTISTAHEDQGFIALSQVPADPRDIMVFSHTGILQVNKATLAGLPNIDITPDYEMCNEPGFEHYLFFINGKAMGHFMSQGLSQQLGYGSTILVDYSY